VELMRDTGVQAKTGAERDALLPSIFDKVLKGGL